MKTLRLMLSVTGVAALGVGAAEIGLRVAPPSERNFTVEAIRESGERGGQLLPVGANFSPAYNRAMGEAMELWNAHYWDEAVSAFQSIWRGQPASPWAAEAELHEACYLKYNARYDEAEERFLSVLNKYPDSMEVRARCCGICRICTPRRDGIGREWICWPSSASSR